MTPEYLLTSLIIILLPGTGVVYTIAYGLGVGWRASMIAAFGCTLGIIPHVAASVTGLAALLHASALAFQAVKYLGVAYLLVMAWGIWRDEGVLQVASTRTSSGAGKIILDGLLLNILNPKLSLFFLSLPAAVRSGEHAERIPAHAGAGRHLHGTDLRSVPWLRRLCRGHATPRHQPAAAAAVAPAIVCRRVCCARAKPGDRRSLGAHAALAT